MRKAVIALFVSLATLCASGQQEFAHLDQAVRDAASRFEVASKCVAGVSVVNLRARRAVAAVRATELFMPASNQKLLTSAFAIERLGADFAFKTRLYRSGDDLVLVGDGDPTLGDPVIAARFNKSIYDQLDAMSAGVARQAPGWTPRRLLLVDCFKLESSRHDDWPANQHARWYAAPISGLSFHNNCYDVTFVAAGGRVSPAVSPQSRFISVDNQLRPGGQNLWSLRASADESAVKLTGTAGTASDKPYSVACDNPPMLLGRVLADRLVRAGVAFNGTIQLGGPEGFDPAKAQLLAEVKTPLSLALGRANKDSLNMVAECLLLRAGDGTWKGSAQGAQQTLAEKLKLGDQFRIADGSGLSRNNLVSAAAMTTLLDNMVRRKDALTLLESMAFSGIDGTVAGRLDGEVARGRVIAKTGYIAGVSALSGYVLDQKNRPVFAFSILINKMSSLADARKFQDELVRMLVLATDSAEASTQPVTH